MTLLACIVVHESGHAVATYLSGGWISEFSIFSLRPHVRVEGAATQTQAAFRAAAGTGFSLLVYFAFVSLTPRAGSAVRFVRSIASCFISAELLGWILSSLLGSSASDPDDARRFLAISGLSPYSVAGVCLTVGLLCIARFLHSGQMGVEARRSPHASEKDTAGQ